MTVKRFPVEAGHVLLFARAIGDENPIYRDAEYAATSGPGHVLAPPTFMQASAHFDPDWRFRPRTGEPWIGSGRLPSGLSGGDVPADAVNLLHAEQHFEYHRQVRAGDVLTADDRVGATWEKQGRRGGTLRFSERITEYRDESGELMITARSVSVVTDQTVEQQDSGRE